MPKKPASKNLARLNEDIKRALTEIIRGMKDPRLQGGLLTVTRADTTKDLSQCKVYVSMLGKEGGAVSVAKALAAAKGYVRSEVAARMSIRRAPELVFIPDDGAQYADKINKMLKSLTSEQRGFPDE